MEYNSYALEYLLLIIGFLITLIAQIKVTSSYSKYKQIENKKRISGF